MSGHVAASPVPAAEALRVARNADELLTEIAEGLRGVCGMLRYIGDSNLSDPEVRRVIKATAGRLLPVIEPRVDEIRVIRDDIRRNLQAIAGEGMEPRGEG